MRACGHDDVLSTPRLVHPLVIDILISYIDVGLIMGGLMT